VKWTKKVLSLATFNIKADGIWNFVYSGAHSLQGYPTVHHEGIMSLGTAREREREKENKRERERE
jgi:hypothetical protein